MFEQRKVVLAVLLERQCLCSRLHSEVGMWIAEGVENADSQHGVLFRWHTAVALLVDDVQQGCQRGPAAESRSEALLQGAAYQQSAQPTLNSKPVFLLVHVQVLRLLGTGGEGETWLCIDNKTKGEVAIKLVGRPIPRSITQIIQV